MILPGNHLTPCGPDIRWQVCSSCFLPDLTFSAQEPQDPDGWLEEHPFTHDLCVENKCLARVCPCHDLSAFLCMQTLGKFCSSTKHFTCRQCLEKCMALMNILAMRTLLSLILVDVVICCAVLAHHDAMHCMSYTHGQLSILHDIKARSQAVCGSLIPTPSTLIRLQQASAATSAADSAVLSSRTLSLIFPPFYPLLRPHHCHQVYTKSPCQS